MDEGKTCDMRTTEMSKIRGSCNMDKMSNDCCRRVHTTRFIHNLNLLHIPLMLRRYTIAKDLSFWFRRFLKWQKSLCPH